MFSYVVFKITSSPGERKKPYWSVRKARQFLKRKNISYTEYDVETSKKGKFDFKKLNGRRVPIVLVGDQRMNGFSEGRMVSMLKIVGYE